MHRQIRKITKTKRAFTSDQVLLRLVYLTIKDISKNGLCRNCGLTMLQLHTLNLEIEFRPSATPFRVRTRGFQPLSTNPKRSDVTQFDVHSYVLLKKS